MRVEWETLRTTENPCACGCGGTLTGRDKSGRPRIFLPGHWAKLRRRIMEPEERETIVMALATERFNICHAKILRALAKQGIALGVFRVYLDSPAVAGELTALIAERIRANFER